MAKKVTKKAVEKEVKSQVKKERTPEQKATRKARRAQRNANVKAMAPIKESANAAITPIFKPLVSDWAPKETSDGLPFSKSIDNPDSLLSQLKRLDEMTKEEKNKKEASELKTLENYRKPYYAGLGSTKAEIEFN